MAEFLREKSIGPDFRVMDLCSGCGVIGFDLQFHEPRIQQIDFIEIQDIYFEHFKRNRALVNKTARFEMHVKNYSEISGTAWENQFDLIVCNPPYFRLGQGKLSPSEFKNRCRFFIDSDFTTLLRTVYLSLKSSGEAYLLVRGLHDHKIDVTREISSCLPQGTFRLLSPIRGTELLHILKPL